MIKTAQQTIRLFQISLTIAKQGIDRVIFPRKHAGYFLTYLNPWHFRNKKNKNAAVSVRLTLEQLGPIFVKFGQLLSTRHDLIPATMAEELAKLQDHVPPFPFKQAKKIIETLHGCSIDTLFKSFEEQPLASASIAQVHAATLHNQQKVVVKILRPKIQRTIQHDIGLLRLIAKWVTRCVPSTKNLHLSGVVEEFEQTLTDELDLMREGANASQIRRQFLHSDLLYVPQIHWMLSKKQALVMEHIHGIPISDISALKQAGMDLKRVSERIIELFYTQVFRDSFFHADLHPGNIFVQGSPQQPQFILVDFGIVGTLSHNDQHYIAENLMAFFHRNYREIAQLHVECGWLPKNTDIRKFESAIRTACEPILERSLKEVSFGQLLVQLFQTGRQFNIQIQPQLLLLQKTLLNLEGIVRALHPDLNFWETSQPFIEKWIRERRSPLKLLKKMQEKLPAWIEHCLNHS